MSAPDSNSAPKAGLATLLPAVLIALGIVQGLITLSQYWLFAPYPETLGWPTSSLAGVSVALAFGAAQRCHGPGWRAVLSAALSVTVVTAVLIANVVAATVILWAIHPPAVTGTGGFAAALFAGLTLTVPVIYGSYELPKRWQATGLRWRGLLWGRRFRRGSFLWIVLGGAGMAISLGSALLLETWLSAAYPVVKGYPVSGIYLLGLLVFLFLANSGPSDLRSAVRSVLGALVVFEVAAAGAVTGAVAMVTLRTSSSLVVPIDILLVIPVVVGAFILVACRPGDRVEEVKG